MFALIAQRTTNPALGPFGGQTGEEFLGKLLPALVSLLLVAGVVIFIFTFLLGGIKWITAGGDKGKVEEAKQTLTNAMIGVVLVLGFFGILTIVECFFGIGLRQINIGKFNISFSSIPACSSGGGGSSTTGTGTGTSTGTTPGNALCSGCIVGGCGIVGQTYLGAGTQNYQCTSTGWAATSNAVTSTTCGTCP